MQVLTSTPLGKVSVEMFNGIKASIPIATRITEQFVADAKAQLDGKQPASTTKIKF